MECTCQKCNKLMDEKNFYTYKNGEKTELCKKCLTMHMDAFDCSTFLWALEKMDVPYIEEEWNTLRDKAFAKNPYKVSGASIFGKYLAKMKLKQWSEYCWADTERLKVEKEKKEREDAAAKQAYNDLLLKDYQMGKISENEYKTLASVESQKENLAPPPMPELKGNFYDETNFISEEQLYDTANQLTEEDRLYLAMKWGRLYKPSEWIELEKKYNEMMKSFDIQDSDSIGTLILTCKTYLKMNQAIDQGDLDGFQKLSRVYDTMRKSSKFTKAQSKEKEEEFVDCIGTMVAYCEKEGGQIPRYDLSVDRDIVDKVIKDLKAYTKSLVYEDTALARQVEEYIKNKENLEKKKRDEEKAKQDGKDNYELEDDDYESYHSLLNEKNNYEGDEEWD